jgi:C-terminal processing protease CtpA/Prc
VVIDVRNNNGGFVMCLDVFWAELLTMISRSRRRNRSCSGSALSARYPRHQPAPLSDAEDFTEGYRALKLGKVVGEPTAGWIVYTSNMPLIDGTVLRIPSTRVEDAAGKTMELAPRPVDVPVKRQVGESYTGRDAQLDTAVQELLKQIGGRTSY